MVVTGLLQTREYAEAVITAAEWEVEPAQIARWVQVRMDRQAALHRDALPFLKVIIDESACAAKSVASRDARAARTPDRYRGAATCGSPGAPVEHRRVSGQSGYFLVFSIAEPEMDVGYAETLGGAIYVEPPDSERFLRIYDCLLDSALGLTESTELIRTIGEDL